MPRRSVPPIPRESELQREGSAWMKSQGSRVFRRNTGGMYDARGNFVRFSERGASDTWIITPAGVHGEVEWKRPGERPTLDQAMWLLKTNGIGHSFAFWVDNLDSLRTVYRHVVNEGYRVAYLRTLRRYRVRGRDVWGQDGDYDLISQ
jgi:hypothetical protein